MNRVAFAEVLSKLEAVATEFDIPVSAAFKIGETYSKIFEPERSPPEARDAALRQLAEYERDHPNHELTPKDLADKFGLHTSAADVAFVRVNLARLRLEHKKPPQQRHAA